MSKQHKQETNLSRPTSKKKEKVREGVWRSEVERGSEETKDERKERQE